MELKPAWPPGQVSGDWKPPVVGPDVRPRSEIVYGGEFAYANARADDPKPALAGRYKRKRKRA